MKFQLYGGRKICIGTHDYEEGRCFLSMAMKNITCEKNKQHSGVMDSLWQRQRLETVFQNKKNIDERWEESHWVRRFI